MQLNLPKDGTRTIYVPVPALLLSRIGLEFVAQAQAGAQWNDKELARDLADLLTTFATPENETIEPCPAFRGHSSVTSEPSKVAVSRARRG